MSDSNVLNQLAANFKFDIGDSNSGVSQSKYFAVGYNDQYKIQYLYAFGDIMPENVLVDAGTNLSHVSYPVIQTCKVDDDQLILTECNVANTPTPNTLLFVRTSVEVVSLIGAFDNEGHQYAHKAADNGRNLEYITQFLDMNENDRTTASAKYTIFQVQKNEFYKTLNEVLAILNTNIIRNSDIKKVVDAIIGKIDNVTLTADQWNAALTNANQLIPTETVFNTPQYIDQAKNNHIKRLIESIEKKLATAKQIEEEKRAEEDKAAQEKITAEEKAAQEKRAEEEKAAQAKKDADELAAQAKKDADNNYIKDCLDAIPDPVDLKLDIYDLQTLPSSNTSQGAELSQKLSDAQVKYNRFKEYATKICKYMSGQEACPDYGNVDELKDYNTIDKEKISTLTSKFKDAIQSMNNTEGTSFTFKQNVISGNNDSINILKSKWDAYLGSIGELIKKESTNVENAQISSNAIDGYFDTHRDTLIAEINRKLNSLRKEANDAGVHLHTNFIQKANTDILNVDPNSGAFITNILDSYDKLRPVIEAITKNAKADPNNHTYVPKAADDIINAIEQIESKIGQIVGDTDILTNWGLDTANEKAIAKFNKEQEDAKKAEEDKDRKQKIEEAIIYLKNNAEKIKESLTNESKKLYNN